MRVEQVGQIICTARTWQLPGDEDERTRWEQKALMRDDRAVENVVPLLHGHSAFEEVLWVRLLLPLTRHLITCKEKLIGWTARR